MIPDDCDLSSSWQSHHKIDVVNRLLQARVDEFVSRVQEKARAYQGDDIMLPMGSDFMYQDAHRWYSTSTPQHPAAVSCFPSLSVHRLQQVPQSGSVDCCCQR